MSVTIPAGPLPGTGTSAVIPGYRLAQLCITGALADLERIAVAVAGERDTAVAELEEQRREAGRLRARVAELEDGLRALLGWYDGTDVDPDTPIWRARVALGLDGRTGHREVADRG